MAGARHRVVQAARGLQVGALGALSGDNPEARPSTEVQHPLPRGHTICLFLLRTICAPPLCLLRGFAHPELLPLKPVTAA
jgi:hypothetical protein